MPVKLYEVPPELTPPPAPRVWRWLVLLPVLLLLGLGLTLWLGGDALTQRPRLLWQIGLGAPMAIWFFLSLIRALVYLGQLSVADGWNDEREADLVQKMRQGRRSQQVLAVSLHTALRESGAHDGEAQRDALLDAHKALRVQAAWQPCEEGIRHSRLAVEQGGMPEAVLRRVLRQVLSDLARVLQALPEDKPLALLLEMDTSVSEENLNGLWQDVWSESGIRQTVTRLEGRGLAAVDDWLDQRIREQTLLLVVAFQVAPAQSEDTAEAVVGLLLGNRLTQTTLEPLAYLHRPEPVRTPTSEGLLYATHQALDWVPVEAASIRHAWCVGTDAQRSSAITTAISDVGMPLKVEQGLHDLDAILGNPGCATPWVAIAAAVESIRDEGEPHLIFSGDSTADAWLWCSAVMPPSPNQE